ncbi:MAG: UDP-glucose/GDP-mannose dehydrogenase family protein [Candidatus Magasanikbacteria bacterium CG_4_10_14_0_2_um_filter_41_10]|uniref:UDP-glucose 6-dehydrogenase n=2 Tax=Candidatus Magasanikiibacteriota TaxID=1752731 RepID=A0A2M7V382_9BACT|nr:MAG: UDP-glucose/GDP-mannose dehydrogenase family protein [Candidatus Magasanikbacteria bacterium CG_4_10_14_0_2_um_filter_41_10]
MNVLYIGAGFVGVCSAAVAADGGHTALVVDIDEKKVQAFASGDKKRIDDCLSEKGLTDLLITHADRIRFTTSYDDVDVFLDTCDLIFICLPTPEVAETGESDLSYYYAGVEKIALSLALRNNSAQTQYIVIVNKSTVPIDMADETQRVLDSHGVTHVGVVSNPEFLVEGKAIEGSLHPDRIVIGAWTETDFSLLRIFYTRFVDVSETQYIEVNPKEAAAGKLLANYYLFAKLAVCFDVIGRTSESFADIQFESLKKIISSDARIGSWGFHDSLYAGGSCLIKDTRSLAYQLHAVGQDVSLLQETYLANNRQLDLFLARATTEAGIVWKGKKIALLGTAFKRDTNDVRNSPSFHIVEVCQEQQVSQIHIYDPSAMSTFQQRVLPSDQIQYVDSAEMAVNQADIIIIATDWPSFRDISTIVMKQEKKPLIMDGRRLLQEDYAVLRQHGCDIIAVGSPFLPKQV